MRWQDKVGPWNNEPSRVRWKDTNSGLECVARRSPHLGIWLGYVVVPEGHKWHEQVVWDARVHGGVSYCGPSPENPNSSEWWVGFDCGHDWDLVPFSYDGSELIDFDVVYRDLGFVWRECANLAAQAQWAQE